MTLVGVLRPDQAIASGLGVLVTTAGMDLIRRLLDSSLRAYSAICLPEALSFLIAAVLAMRLGRIAEERRRLDLGKGSDG